MRVLCLCFFFEPDLSAGSFKNSALVRELGRQLPSLSEVEVLTTLPNRYAQFSISAPAEERCGNIHIRRVQLPAHNNGVIDQSRSFIAYAQAVMKLTRGKSYDLIYASSSRLMMAVLGDWISRSKDAPLYLDIRDLFVDTVKDVLPGRITAKLALPLFSKLEKRAVYRADRVNLVSGGFIPYFQKHYPGVNLSNHTNGIDHEFMAAAPAAPQPIRKVVPEVLYAGNIGEGQGLEHIIPPLSRYFQGRLNFRLIGSGGRLQQLKDCLREKGCKNVVVEDPVPRNKLAEFYAQSDILFLHLNDYEAFERVLPSKIFEYGALGKPIWAGVGGFAADFIRKHVSNSAVFRPCDVDAAIRSFARLEMWSAPRHDFTIMFARHKIVKRMAREIIQTAKSAGEP